MFSIVHWTRRCVVWLVVVGTCASAAAADSAFWATGDELREKLATPVSVTWDNAPLDRALEGLSKSQKIAILRDRRVDPGQPLELAIDREPLSEALAHIAAHLKLGYCQLGPVAYFGPPRTAARLRTLSALRLEDARKLSPAMLQKLLLMRSSHWDRLAEPRDLAASLVDEIGASLVGAQRIPHDLWPVADLPPLSWIDRFTLLAGQFDLTFRLADEGRRVELVSMPEEAMLSRTYFGGRDAARVARRWSGALPGAKIQVRDNKIRVLAPLEGHEYLAARLRGQPTRRTTVTPGKEVYQLTVDSAALDGVVAQLAKQLGLEFAWDSKAIDAAGIAVDQLISVNVRDVGLDELLAAVLDGTGLSYRRADRAVAISPK